MGALSEKIRSGLLELSTDNGPLYASPSTRERIYLLWTFRNFRSLPKQVLNLRQQQLIDKLLQAPTLSRRRPAMGAPIIGVVENVRLSDRKEAAASANKVVEIARSRAEAAMAQAVGSGRIWVQEGPRAHRRPVTAPFEQRPANVKAVIRDSAGQRRKRNAKLAPLHFDSIRTRAPHWLEWALIAAFGAALFGTLFYFGRPTPLIMPPHVAEAQTPPTPAPPATDSLAQPQPSALAERPPKPSGARPPTQLLPSAIVMQPAAATPGARQPVAASPIAPQASAAGIFTQAIAAVQAPEQSAIPAIASRQDESGRGYAGIAREVVSAATNPTPPERVVMAAAPQSFSYPVAPNPKLTGKVSLKIFIGADGSVRETRIISGNRVLADAAVRAVRRWRYRPAELNGHAAEAETNVTINFAGDDAVTIAYRQ